MGFVNVINKAIIWQQIMKLSFEYFIYINMVIILDMWNKKNLFVKKDLLVTPVEALLSFIYILQTLFIHYNSITLFSKGCFYLIKKSIENSNNMFASTRV